MNSEQRTLLLLRHAKSDHPTGTADHDRPLAKRGICEAGLAGNWLRANAPTIDHVLCSTATRTRNTLQHTGVNAPDSYRDELYDAAPGTVITAINAVDDDVRTLLVTGHEPAMSRVAASLAGAERTNTAAVQQLSMKFPTSSIAVCCSYGAVGRDSRSAVRHWSNSRFRVDISPELCCARAYITIECPNVQL